MTALEEKKIKSIACKYCARLNDPDYKNDEMAQCFRYNSCTNPNDKCSRFILSVPERMIRLMDANDGCEQEGGYSVRPDGSLVISLNDVPDIKAKIIEEERRPIKESENKLYIIAIIILAICTLFFFILGQMDVLFSFLGWICAAGMLLWIVLYGIHSNSR